MKHKEILFPYKEIRPIQNEVIQEIGEAISQKKKILLHAPTGIGKTIAVLGPALAYALANNKTIICSANIKIGIASTKKSKKFNL